MPKGVAGILVEADESIMAIIKKIDAQNGHSFILEDLGDKACLVKEDRLSKLEYAVKTLLQEKVPNPKESDDEA